MTDNITLPREVGEYLMEVLEESPHHGDWSARDCIALDALRTALAAPKQEPTRLYATTTGVLLGSEWIVWNTPKGANDEIMSQETADLLNRMFADIEALRRDAERWKDLATDAVSGLSYIRQYYGQLAGVGWDRVFAKKAAIDAAMKEGKQ